LSCQIFFGSVDSIYRGMATSMNQKDYIHGQLEATKLGNFVVKKMFGEYGVYCSGMFFGLICDDQLFVKTQPAGKNPRQIELPDEVLEMLDLVAKPYPGSLNMGKVQEEDVENIEKLRYIVSQTLQMLDKK
jgi:TfoX/Sxy family transcriptional regulator of competence genes